MLTRTLASLGLAASLCLTGVGTVHAQDAAPAETQQQQSPEAAYEATLDKRAKETLEALKLDDQAKAQKIAEALKQQYRDLSKWHDANDARRDELRKAAKAAPDNAAAQAELAKVDAELAAIHDPFVAMLNAELTPEQVVIVKEKMAGGRTDHTWRGYQALHPDLPEAEKKVVLEMLAQARDEMAPAGSSKEKVAIIGKWKGRINNYLSKQGIVDPKTKAKRAATQAAATQQAGN